MRAILQLYLRRPAEEHQVQRSWLARDEAGLAQRHHRQHQLRKPVASGLVRGQCHSGNLFFVFLYVLLVIF